MIRGDGASHRTVGEYRRSEGASKLNCPAAIATCDRSIPVGARPGAAPRRIPWLCSPTAGSCPWRVAADPSSRPAPRSLAPIRGSSIPGHPTASPEIGMGGANACSTSDATPPPQVVSAPTGPPSLRIALIGPHVSSGLKCSLRWPLAWGSWTACDFVEIWPFASLAPLAVAYRPVACRAIVSHPVWDGPGSPRRPRRPGSWRWRGPIA